jgi:hypothetical protein
MPVSRIAFVESAAELEVERLWRFLKEVRA